MVTRPKTTSYDVTVGAARAVLDGDHVHMVLLIQGGRLRGTIVREDLQEASEDDPALLHARLAGRTVGPSVRADVAQEWLARTGARRFAVVDGAGDLLGLLCLKRRRTGFCSDGDVASRALDPH